jgi:hypothetical protein
MAQLNYLYSISQGTNLVDNNNNTIMNEKVPRIYTNTLFNTSSTSSGLTIVPMTCPEIVSAARADGMVNNFLSRYKLTDLITNIQNFRDGLIGNNIKQTQNINYPVNKPVLDYFNRIKTSQLPVLRQVNNCLSDLSPDFQTLEESQEKVDESKTRLDAILDSDKNVSYYEGWFPLFRPMSEVSLFSLFAVSIFSLLFSIAVFLRLNGIELELKLPGVSEFSTESFIPYVKIGSVLAAIISMFVIFYR